MKDLCEFSEGLMAYACVDSAADLSALRSQELPSPLLFLTAFSFVLLGTFYALLGGFYAW